MSPIPRAQFELTIAVANLPAEITHLYEEMQAKEQQIQACNNIIEARDGSLQKFVKLNGSLVKNPKEEPYNKLILQNYEKAQTLQDEKVHLAEKAAQLVSLSGERQPRGDADIGKAGSACQTP